MAIFHCYVSSPEGNQYFNQASRNSKHKHEGLNNTNRDFSQTNQLNTEATDKDQGWIQKLQFQQTEFSCHLVMTNSSPWKDPPFLSIFRNGVYHLLIHRNPGTPSPFGEPLGARLTKGGPRRHEETMTIQPYYIQPAMDSILGLLSDLLSTWYLSTYLPIYLHLFVCLSICLSIYL